MIGVRSRRVLRLKVGRGSLRAETLEGGSVTWAGEAAYTGPGDLAEAIAQLAAEPPRACRRLEVRLERPPVQLRTLADLPPVKRRHLAALIAQQAGRFFRKNGQALVTDAVWVSQGDVPVARVAAVEEPLVEAIAAGARAAGLWLETIGPAEDSAELALLPASERASRERAARKRTQRLALVAAAIWLGVSVLFVARLGWERRAVDRELAALREPLATVLDARRELRDAEATLVAVAAADQERGRGLALLAAVSEALPDSGILTSLTWDAEGRGVLAGAARRATEVVARLDRMPPLAGVRLEGPVVRESVAGRDWERFTVLFSSEGRARKATGS